MRTSSTSMVKVLRSCLMGCVTAAALVATLATSSEAQAQDEGMIDVYKVAVFNVVSEGASTKLAKQITQVIKGETRRNPKYNLVKQEDIALLDSLLVVGCEEPEPDCMKMLAESVGAERLVYGRLIAVEELYDIEVNVFDSLQKRVVKRWNKRFTANADAIGFFVKEMEVFLGERERPKATRLRVTANIKDAYVLIDSERVGRTPYISDELVPGKHRIEVKREGYKTWSYDANAEEGAQLILRASLEREDGVAVGPSGGGTGVGNGGGGQPPRVTTDPGGSALKTYGWIIGGVGVAALATGGVLGALVLNTEDTFDETNIQREAYDLRDDGERLAVTANVFYTVGGVGVLTGAVLLLLAPDSTESAPPDEASSSVQIMPLRGGAGVVWGGGF